MAPQVRIQLAPPSLSIMVLYLLPLVLLLLGVVESQTANLTDRRPSDGEGELSANSTMRPVAVTSSLFEDETRLIEEELQRNDTVTEDDERFQDQNMQFQLGPCLRDKLVEYSTKHCGSAFDQEMAATGAENWCIMDKIIRPYNQLTLCLELLSTELDCFYPNPTTQDFFIQLHSRFFSNCSKEEPRLWDAPQGLVVLLTLIPVGLIPVLVYVVIWKSEVQK